MEHDAVGYYGRRYGYEAAADNDQNEQGQSDNRQDEYASATDRSSLQTPVSRITGYDVAVFDIGGDILPYVLGCRAYTPHFQSLGRCPGQRYYQPHDKVYNDAVAGKKEKDEKYDTHPHRADVEISSQSRSYTADDFVVGIPEKFLFDEIFFGVKRGRFAVIVCIIPGIVCSCSFRVRFFVVDRAEVFDLPQYGNGFIDLLHGNDLHTVPFMFIEYFP